MASDPTQSTPPCLICAYPSTSRCSGCKAASYCSKAHQKLAWAKHKKLCKIYQTSLPPAKDTYCGLCGSTGPLTKTECCDRTICDDEADYQAFTYSAVSCARNHRRYTVCAYHFNEEHEGKGGAKGWKECVKCRESFRAEDLVSKGTSSFNFKEDEWLDPPAFEKTLCSGCGKQVKTASEPYSRGPSGIQCMACMGGMNFGGVSAMDS